MSASLPNGRKNLVLAVAEFGVGAATAFLGYKFVLEEGGTIALGLWATLFASVSLFRIGDLGLAAATMRAVARVQTNARSVIVTGIAAGAASYAAISVLGWIAVEAVIPWLMPAEHWAAARAALPLIVVALYFFNVSNIVLGALQGLQASYIKSTLSICAFAVQLTVAALLVPTHGLIGYAVAQVVQFGSLLLVGWLCVRRLARIAAPLPLRLDFHALRDLVGFGLRTQAASVTAGLFEPLAKIVVGLVAGLHTQALFELAFKTGWIARSLAVAIVTATVPGLTSIAATNPEAVLPVYQKLRQQITATAFATLMMAVLASPLLSLHWLGAVDQVFCQYVALLAAGMFLSAICAPAYNLATVYGTQRHNVVVNIVSVVVVGAASWFAPPSTVIGVISAVMVVSSLAIRQLNEPLVFGPGAAMVVKR